MKKLVILIVMGAATAGLQVHGADLVWTGAADGNWGTGVNWTNSTGTALSFSTGDNVLFDESASVQTITLSASVTPGNILFDHDQLYTLAASGGKIVQADTFIKRGSGRLDINCTGHTFTNDMRIEEGELRTVIPNGGYLSPLGNMRVERQIYVSTNAILCLKERNTMGSAAEKANIAEIYVDQGTLQFGTPDLASNLRGVNTLGDLTLNDAMMVYTNVGQSTYGFLKVCRTFTLLGTQPYTFPTYGKSDLFMILNSDPYTEINVSDITGDADTDVTFQFPFRNVVSYPDSGMIKTGPGSMRLESVRSDFEGNLEVREGELIAVGPASGLTSESPLGARYYDRTLYVGTNATLTFPERNTMGPSESATPKIAITVDNAAFNIEGDFHTVLGDLTLDNSTFTYGDGYDATRGILRLGGKLSLKGDTPYTFNPASAATTAFFNLNDDPLTEINVADITGDAARDAVFMVPFKDLAYTDVDIRPSGFAKTGPGTLFLTNNTDRFSTFSGNIEVREGTLMAVRVGSGADPTASVLGNARVSRQIYVSTNATLVLAERNTLGSALGANQLECEIYVDQGTLQLGPPEKYRGVNTVGYLTLNDGTLDFEAMQNDGWGFIKVARTFRLRGTQPYHFENTGSSGCFMVLNGGPYTDFDVADITADSDVDVTFDFPFKNSSTTACGLIKSGAGTMRVTAASVYSAGTWITNGVLLVDGSLNTAAPLTVESGGWLGGTGTVGSVTLEAGAGFEVTEGQADMLTINGSLTVEGGGTVRILNPDSLPGTQVHAVFADVSGTLTGSENFADWTVEIAGVETSVDYRVRVSGSEIMAGYSPAGTLILVH